MKDGNIESRDTVEKYLIDLADFDRRSRNVWKLIKSVRDNKPMEPLENSTMEG
jgi:hypothetical protein